MELKTEPLPYGAEHGLEGGHGLMTSTGEEDRQTDRQHRQPSRCVTSPPGMSGYEGGGVYPGHSYPGYPGCGEEGRTHPQVREHSNCKHTVTELTLTDFI